MKKKSVMLQSGAEETVTLQGISPALFDQAVKAVDGDDYFRLIELTCDRPPGWARMLDLESFGLVMAETQEANRGFFDFYSARASLAALRNPMSALKALPPEVLKELVRAKREAQATGTTPSPS